MKKAELEAQKEKESVELEFKQQTEKILAESNARKAQEEKEFKEI